MSANYYRRRKAKLHERAMKGVAARERKRMEPCADQPGGWPLVRTVWLAVYAAPDGRHLELHAASERGQWVRCGSARATVAAMGRILWGMRKKVDAPR